ncbi:hypothetical protein NB231_07065 [Nitrococcus mobilis Nb-231]|uniref:Transposase n=1 Tax=Nitrococcus mobilis Nb-231 TaxID=314278 RepID=A4BUX9_9GAMM|nr:hypothetical protein NB231_07065 [Nitrococcus mobilis Nb-231]
MLSQFAERACGGRDRIFTPLVVLKAFLFQVLSQDGSCKHAVARVLSERLQSGQSANSINTGPYCKARQRLPRAPLENAVRESGQTLHQRAPSAWGWRGHRVVLADGTTALMPDTLDNQREFPQQGNQQPGLGFPIVRIVALISLGAGAVLDYALGPYQARAAERALCSAPSCTPCSRATCYSPTATTAPTRSWRCWSTTGCRGSFKSMPSESRIGTAASDSAPRIISLNGPSRPASPCG